MQTSFRLREADLEKVGYIIKKDPRVNGQVSKVIPTAFNYCFEAVKDYREVIRQGELLCIKDEVSHRKLKERTVSFSVEKDVFQHVQKDICDQLGLIKPRISFIVRTAILALCVSLHNEEGGQVEVVVQSIDGVSIIKEIADLLISEVPEDRTRLLKIKKILDDEK